jgi:hypothetical protein
MAKIENIVVVFGGERIEFQIWYSAKNKFFIKGGLPTKVANVLGNKISTEYYDSPMSLSVAMNLFAKDYDDAIHTAKKVIVYNICFGASVIEDINATGTKYSGSLKNRTQGTGFNFNYHICIQHTIENKVVIKELVKKYFTEGELVESNHVYHVDYDESVIDWTPEREQFFSDLKETTNELCEKIRSFFGDDDTKRLQAIDSGVKLLGGK